MMTEVRLMVEFLEGQHVGKLLRNMIHEKTQVHAKSVDLTMKAVSRIATTSSIDFGGSEFAPGDRVTLMPKKMDPSDKYGWWLLAAGEFLIEYNECLSLPPRHIAIIQPHQRLIEAGATHETRLIAEPTERLMSLVQVCQADVRIKENARISELIVLRND
jgi:deoxycytidine triphosphate deaminase